MVETIIPTPEGASAQNPRMLVTPSAHQIRWPLAGFDEEMTDQVFINALILRLRELPGTADRKSRHESWLTAEQISKWWIQERGGRLSPGNIDEMLRPWWLEDLKSQKIRPAKYPDRDTAYRLWGHVDRVGALSEGELNFFRADQPIELEPVCLVEEAPRYFLSYAAPDLHFAARVRLSLASFGVRSWMFSAEVEQDNLVFESVQIALSQCHRIVALGTAFSLASAWVDTEIQTVLGMDKPVTIAFDGNHANLMKLLEIWSPPKAFHQPNFDVNLLPQLKAEYQLHSSAARTAKYSDSATEFLRSMAALDLCIYPRRPGSWKGHKSMRSFEELMLGYGID